MAEKASSRNAQNYSDPRVPDGYETAISPLIRNWAARRTIVGDDYIAEFSLDFHGRIWVHKRRKE